MKCEVCNSSNTFPFLDLGKQPLCDDLIKINSNKKCKKYTSKIYFCNTCYTAFHKTKVKPSKLFPKNYHYRARFTKDVIKGMKDLVISIKKFTKKKRLKILDIGCNDGSLLDIFYKNNFITFGIEPTDAVQDANKKHILINNFFNKSTAKSFLKKNSYPDIITFTNVFAHINNLRDLIKNLKIICNKNTLIVIENHYLNSIIKKKQFDTFYHEHPRTYSLRSFTFIVNQLGFKLLKVQFPKRYGGNIRVFIGRGNKNSKNILRLISKEKKQLNELKNLQKNMEKWKHNKKKFISKLNSKYGPLIAKAFPGRASILINILKLNKKNISSVYEQVGSPKIGYKVPGTDIPILSDKYLKRKDKSVPIINLAWHITKEIRFYLKKNNINNEIVDIISKNDFK
tara:strand:+ start:1853 stop:3046 length:1194 start_codon:yes stop_codon:yes gene_type:complete